MRLINAILVYCLLLISSSAVAVAQSEAGITVTSFRELPEDMSARVTDKILDQNGEPAAIIKVVTSEQGFSVDNGMLGIVDLKYKTGEMWVYVPHGTLKLTLAHQKYGVLRDYYFDIAIRKATVYEMKINTANYQYGDSQYFVLNYTPSEIDVDLYIDETTYIQASGGSVAVWLQRGEHTYKLLAPNYVTEAGVFEISPEKGTERLTVALEKAARDITFTLPGGDTFKMIYVEGGSFTMGATAEQVEAESDEYPAHNVTLSSYYMAEFEVTQKLWQAVMGTTIYQQRDKAGTSWPTFGVNASYPMYYINYSECEEFIGRLNNLLRDKLPQGYRFRLPTEAQWEYAARGGKKAKNTLYAGGDYISEVAWYWDNSSSSVHTVGSKSPNELGIYDMSGNVLEWCADWYSSSYYLISPATDPANLSSGSYRVLRGGSWSIIASYCRVAIRFNSAPSGRNGSGGMRVALVQ